MKYDITFIGELPPPYNGVSVKDKLMFEQIFGDSSSQIIDLVECKRNPLKIPLIFGRIAIAMIGSKSIVIGVGSLLREKILLTMQYILTGHKGLSKVMMIIMGGRYPELISKQRCLKSLLTHVGSIWVESNEMIDDLKEQGILRAYLFPNCRTEEGSRPPIARAEEEPLKLVYFSGVNIEHGMDDIIKSFRYLDATKQCVRLDVYGIVEEDIKERFTTFVQNYGMVQYRGVYDTSKGDTYAMLNQYDVMLRPSKRDGVAGALVEGKMAGITAIVSDCGFNNEVVCNGEEGIVIQQPLAENLSKAINLLISDHTLLMKLKNGAFESRKRYCVNTYKQQMIECALKIKVQKNEEMKKKNLY